MDPYTWSNEDLLEALIKAAARCGVSRGGLVISAMAGSDQDDLQILQGAMIARLNGQTPPFACGDRVVATKEAVEPDRAFQYDDRATLREGTRYCIEAIYYLNNEGYSTILPHGRYWRITLSDINGLKRIADREHGFPKYDPAHFRLVSKAKKKTAAA